MAEFRIAGNGVIKPVMVSEKEREERRQFGRDPIGLGTDKLHGGVR